MNLRALIEDIKQIDHNIHLKESELRLLFLYQLSNKIGLPIKCIEINNKCERLESIANDNELFESLLRMDHFNYNDYRYREYANININDLYNTSGFKDRIHHLQKNYNGIENKKNELSKEKLGIKSLKLSQLILKYKLGDYEEYKSIELSPMMDIFIRRGYLDEEYYDYISFFYKKMISQSDRDLLLSIKQQKKSEYDYHIDKIENFAKELSLYMFNDDSILNIELLDFLCSSNEDKFKEYFALFMERINNENCPLDFLAQYYQYGKQVEQVFQKFISWDKDLTWKMILNRNDNNQKSLLEEAWLKYAKELTANSIYWLNSNFDFLVDHYQELTLDRCIEIIAKCKFDKLDSSNTSLLDCAIEKNAYSINAENLVIIILNLYSDSDVTINNLNYTRICNTENNDVKSYFSLNVSNAIEVLKDENKDENEDSLLWIINNSELSDIQKISYLTNQKNRINNVSYIENSELYNIALSTLILLPSWENIINCYKSIGNVSNELLNFIFHYSNDLSSQKCNDDNREELFLKLFGCNTLTIDVYKKLIACFDCKFDGNEICASLEEDRLKIIIDNNLMPFNKENIEIINRTDMLAEYILKNPTDFISNLDFKYDFNKNITNKLLQSKVFSDSQKLEIINITPNEILTNSVDIANSIVKLMSNTENIFIQEDALYSILKNSSSSLLEDKIRCVNLIISNFEDYDIEIETLLGYLNDDYVKILDVKKKAKVTNCQYNKNLLELLKSKKYISNYRIDKDVFLRVSHRNQN